MQNVLQPLDARLDSRATVQDDAYLAIVPPSIPNVLTGLVRIKEKSGVQNPGLGLNADTLIEASIFCFFYVGKVLSKVRLTGFFLVYFKSP